MAMEYRSMIGLTPIYRIVSLVSGVGKTSLGTAVVKVLSKRGVKLAVIKQTHEKIVDELSDLGRYYRAGASTVVVASPEAMAVYREPFTSLSEIVTTMKYYPLVLVEGYRGVPIGKAIAVITDPREINVLIKEEKGLWYIVSNDVDVVENAKSIGYNALLMDEVEALAGEIYNDAIQQIASKFSGDPEVCGVDSWITMAEKILHGLALPYECPLAYPIRIVIDDIHVELDPKSMRIIAGLLEGFIAGLIGSGARPKKIRIEYEIKQHE